MPSSDILEQAGRVSSLIAAARGLIGDGRTVDLVKLEENIRALCENAENAGLKDTAPVAKALGAIVAELTTLEGEISARHGSAAGQSIRRAIDAYGRDGGEG